MTLGATRAELVVGSPGSRRFRLAARGWATGLGWLCLCACSGSTDVVGVLEPQVTDVAPAASQSDQLNRQNLGNFAGSADPGSVDPDSEFLVVAGLPLRDWQRASVPWPLATPLHVFFSAGAATSEPYNPPEHVERAAFAQMGPAAETRRDDVRFVAPTGDAAERLALLFSESFSQVFPQAPDGMRGEPRSLIVRDQLSDVYLVVLGSASCGRTASHHGGPCPDFVDDDSNLP